MTARRHIMVVLPGPCTLRQRHQLRSAIILYLVPLPLSICTYHVNSCSLARKIAYLDVIDSTFSLAYISNWNASDVLLVKTTNEYLFHCKDANQICTGVTFDFLESKIRTEIPTLVERFFSRKKSRFDLYFC